jgi:dienelactone hydrolase
MSPSAFSMTVALALAASGLSAQENASEFKVPDDVVFRADNIMSEGTRMSAEIFAPRQAKSDKLPTIIMSHGWGGTAASLRPDAIVFARAGYLVVTFDYRGWGKSDSRLILSDKKLERKNGALIAQVKEVREVVDPIDQTTDILNAIHWVNGEKQCDPERIGLWGSSYSGGHVVYVAARGFVESRCGAVVLGSAYLLPALSVAGASLASPCSVSTSRSANRTCPTKASGSRTAAVLACRSHTVALGKRRPDRPSW